MNNFCKILAVSTFCVSMNVTTINAQFTGYTVELDTIFLEEGSDLEFFGTYRVYANFTNQNDAISALFSDVGALDTPPMFIDAPCGCHNPVSGNAIMDATNTSVFWSTFPDWEFDTYWTIGMTSADATGLLPQSIGMPGGDEICASSTNDGTVYVLGIPPNALAGVELSILIAQVTTCGDWSLQACFQTFVNADNEDIDLACPDLLEVVHPYLNGDCVNDSDGDGVCDEFEIPGCSEPEACNYEPNATDDSMDCDYTCYGCLEEWACNFNSFATVDDGTCDFLSCAGCMNTMACNFDIEATIENSSCILPGDPCDDGYENSINDEIQPGSCECLGIGCNDPAACNYEPNAIPNSSLCNYITLFAISGEVNPTANMLFSYSYPNTSGSTYEWVSTSGDVTDGEGTSDVSVSWWGGGAGSLCVTETNNGGCSGEEICFSVNISAVSIDELEDGSFQVFPSPASTDVHIVIQNGVQSGELFIRDTSGRLVRRCSLQNETTINVSDLPRGAYLFQLNLQSEQPSYRRVILN